MNIAIVGTGYVGLVSGTCFSEMGYDVICVDIDESKVEKLSNGNITIFEPGLEVFFERNLREGRLQFTTDLLKAVQHAEIIFLALPTPPSEDGSADLSYVLGVGRDIAKLLVADPALGYKVIVNKSTVPVGTADKVTAIMEEQGLASNKNFNVVSNPEFLREGVAVEDFMKPERVVIGSSNERATDLMKLLYEPFVRQGNPILAMDERSAEMTKYAANSFLATKITFMNEVANLCEKVGANVDNVRVGIGLDSRIGKLFLYPGIGFGGSCFPKDVKALKQTADQYDYDFAILKAVLNVNEEQRRILVDRIMDYFDGDVSGKNFAVWGLAFKPNTDDVREAPSHVIINELIEKGASVTAFDPEAIDTTKAVLGDKLAYAEDRYSLLSDVDALIICTEWHEFRRPDFKKMRGLMKSSLIFDGRNLFKPERMAELGFEYFSVGRPHHPVSASETVFSE
ncbi:MAG: UDP-glucose/GDP-mannose dehydrogenase family protein [Rhodothermales bacterium]